MQRRVNAQHLNAGVEESNANEPTFSLTESFVQSCSCKCRLEIYFLCFSACAFSYFAINSFLSRLSALFIVSSSLPFCDGENQIALNGLLETKKLTVSASGPARND